jgi:DNA polymerase V
LLDLAPAAAPQSGLFDAPDDARSIARMRAIDRLNDRFGRGTIAFGTAGERQVWALRREFLSPRYTTDWDELLHV